MNIVRFYNQHRKRFWMAILIIVSFLIFIQLLNYLAIRDSEKQLSDMENTIKQQQSNKSLIDNNSKSTSNQSGITGKTIEDEELYFAESVIQEFFDLCNKKDLKNAYDMLTDECKEVLYPTLEIFSQNYYNNMFGETRKTFSLQNWSNDTYIVTISEDALATGKTSDSKMDYVTIVDEQLNISSYIGRKLLEKEEFNEDINIDAKIESVDTFMDYEIYNINIRNESENTICLGNVDESNSIYIRDSNSNGYGFYNHELSQDELILKSNFSTNLQIKFYSSYVSNKKIEYLVFSNIYLNYENNIEQIGEFYIDLK